MQASTLIVHAKAGVQSRPCYSRILLQGGASQMARMPREVRCRTASPFFIKVLSFLAGALRVRD